MLLQTHLLDTSVFSQPIKERPDPRVVERWRRLGGAAICTSAICLAEVLQGLQIRQSEAYWARYRAYLENRFRIVGFDKDEAQVYGLLAAQTRRMGRTKPVLDLMIAATARFNGLIVATLNAKDFADIPGLVVEDWSQGG